MPTSSAQTDRGRLDDHRARRRRRSRSFRDEPAGERGLRPSAGDRHHAMLQLASDAKQERVAATRVLDLDDVFGPRLLADLKRTAAILLAREIETEAGDAAAAVTGSVVVPRVVMRHAGIESVDAAGEVIDRPAAGDRARQLEHL